MAKSRDYVTGNDASSPPNKALVEGDQVSHVFRIVWPWRSGAVSRGGPTFQSGYHGQAFSASNVEYDQFGFMPNSCSRCHASARSWTPKAREAGAQVQVMPRKTAYSQDRLV